MIEKTINVSCIIPCHKTGESLINNLPNICKIFNNNYVYIADNGIVEDEYVKEICKIYDVNYLFYPIPNKTYALLETAIYIEKFNKTKYVVLLDDDTYLDTDFYIREDLLKKPMVAGYCCNIIIDKPNNLLEQLIDFEYRSISYTNSLKSSLQFCHGIIAVYHLRKMITIYSKLCTLPGGLPFGEDSFAGIDFRLAGYKLLHDDLNIAKTYCPDKIISCTSRDQGFGASSLFKQRVLRWYLSWIRRVPQEIALLLYYDTGTLIGNISYRLDILWYFIISIIASSWLILVIKVLITNTWLNFGILHGILYIVNMLSAFVRYFAFGDILKKEINWYIPLFVPIMNIIVCIMMTLSFIITIFYYVPFVQIDYNKTYNNSL